MSYFQKFYREQGVRQLSDLRSAPANRIVDIELPRNCTIHYYSEDDVESGPNPDHFLIFRYESRVMLVHNEQMIDPKGKFTQSSQNSSSLISEYHKRFRKLRKARDYTIASRDEQTLVVVNNALLNKLYRFRRDFHSLFYKWYNIINTTIKSLVEKVNSDQRDHLLVLTLPETIHKPKLMNDAVKYSVEDYTNTLLELFYTPPQQLIIQIYTLLAGRKEDSAFADLDNKDLKRVNVVINVENHAIVLNLGHLVYLFYDNYEQLSQERIKSKGNDPQRAFIRLLISMSQYRTNDISHREDVEEEHEQQVDDTELSEQDPLIKENQIERDLDKIEKAREKANTQQILANVQSQTPREEIKTRIQKRLERGRITPAQARRLERMTDNTGEIKNPFGEGTIDEFRQISEEDIKINEDEINIPDLEGVTDESMLASTLKAFDSKYINNVLEKDVSNAILDLEKAGVIVRDINVEEHESADEHYKQYRVRVQPVDGEPSTIEFTLPVIDENGVFKAGGHEWRFKKQRNDSPIRKVNPKQVALSSYFAKLYVERSQKKSVDYEGWINRNVLQIGFDDNDKRVHNVKHVASFDHKLKLPRIYTIISKRFREFSTEDNKRFYFDYNNRKEQFSEQIVDSIEQTTDMIVCGQTTNGYLVIGNDNIFFEVTKESVNEVGDIEHILQLDRDKAPVEIAEYRAYSGNVIPLGVMLGFYYGFDELLTRLGVEYRSIWTGKQTDQTSNEYKLKFNDETLLFDKQDRYSALILAGFNRYHQSILKYPRHAFNKQETFINLLEDAGFRVGFSREIELTFEMFVDSITHQLLESIGEPTTFEGLLFRSAELLLNDQHPKETDMEAMRIRGYERVAGHVYEHLSKSIRSYRARGVGAGSKVELNPKAVYIALQQDPSSVQVEDTNPIHDLKQVEDISFAGKGGRSTQTMVKRTRAFHESDLGITSEATVDSSKVGSNAYLSANPQVANLRGVPLKGDQRNLNPTSLLSTSALNAPAVDHDSANRINFVSIQNTHVVASKGAVVSPFRTGYEKVIAHRVSDKYAHTASMDGEVIGKDSDVAKIQYTDGSEDHIRIGRFYGDMQGTKVPHEVVCDLGVGDKVSKGDVVAYNTGFFERDPLDNRQVLYRDSVMGTVALMENQNTWEDANAVSTEFSSKLESSITETRTVLVNFEQRIKDLKEENIDVNPDDVLCTIDDGVGEDDEQEEFEILKLMNTHTPKSKYEGKLESIEVFYNGDKEMMSESVREVVDKADRKRKKRAKKRNQTPTTGEISTNTKINKKTISQNTIAIVFYITKSLHAGVGDKMVFANQMKSVVSRVLTGINETESGKQIDAMFGYTSISNRIVLSPEIMGTTNTLLMRMSEIVANTYFQD